MKRSAFLLLFVLALAGRAAAAPITITQTFTGSGDFDGTPYFNSLVTLTLEGDTDNVVDSGLFTLAGIATVEVAGHGFATFTSDVRAVINPGLTRGGFGDFGVGLGLLFIDDPAFATYDLTSSIGPLSGGGQFNSGASFAIDLGGGFSIESILGDVTYQAAVAPVPEPATLMLLVAGGLGLLRRRTQHRRLGV